MTIAQGVDIEFCVGYPFNDNSNVFDFAMNNHKIDEFVETYVAENIGNPYHVAEFNIASGSVKVRLPEDDYGTEYNNKKYLRSYNTLLKCNYMRVTYYESGRKFYCFIDNVVFDNNLLSATIFFTIDVWNTYRNYIDFKTSFIEREHVESDTKFKHVIDEGFSPSQYYVNTNITPHTQPLSNFGYVVGLSDATFITTNHDTTTHPACVFEMAKNIYSGLLVYVSDRFTLARLISMYVEHGKSDGITGVYLMPLDIISGSVSTPAELIYFQHSDDPPTYFPVAINTESSSAITPNLKIINAPTKFTVKGVSYTPKNNKCFCYPYTMVRVTNHLGNELNLHFEKSGASNNSITIAYAYVPNINGCCYISVQNYDGVSSINADYILKCLDYPTVPYAVDSYDAWYSANSNMLSNQQVYINKDYNFAMKTAYAQTALQESANAKSAVLGIATGLPLSKSAGLSGLFDYAMNQQNLYQQSVLKKASMDYDYEKSLASFNASLSDKAVIPDKICGINAPNALLLLEKNQFIISVLCPSIEEITAIDNYFSKYGYKVNVFDTLHYYRPRFDFKKMPDCNIVGNVPSDIINTIRGLFQQGITIWHDHEHIFEYDENASGGTPPQPPQPQ